MTHTPRLALEPLERRDVPAAFGNPWQQAHALTLSFAPDGVRYSNQLWGGGAFASGLFAELNGAMPAAAWQEELLRALDAWAAEANINVGLVADSGAAFGPTGLSPSARPATFRIGAGALGTDVIAVNVPNDPLAAGYAGALLLNTAYDYSRGGAAGSYDLYTIALHEFGNLLGLADSPAADSALYGHYVGARAGLSAADAAAVRGLYGARRADAFDAAGPNDTLAAASALAAVGDPAAPGRSRVVADGDITTAGDADVYRFTVPAGVTSLTVRLGTAGKSLLAGRIEVYDAAGQLLGTRAGTGPLQGDPVLTFAGLTPGAEYFVRVTGARADAFRTGAYQLRVGFGYDPVTETVVDTVQRFGADGGANNTPATASALAPTAGFAANARYEWAGVIESRSDLDYYRFTAPAAGGVMTVTVLSSGWLSTSATLLDAAGQVVAANVLVNWEGGMYRAQVANLTGGAAYTLLLKVQDPAYSAWSGNYLATVDFAQPLAAVRTLTSGTAGAGSRIAVGVDVQETGAFRFGLTGTSSNTAAVNWLSMYIYDASGALVAAVGTDGITSTDTLFAVLKKGQYTILLQPEYRTGSTAGATLAYTLTAGRLTDPIDPYAPADPTLPPPPPPPPPPGRDLVDVGIVLIPPPWLP